MHVDNESWVGVFLFVLCTNHRETGFSSREPIPRDPTRDTSSLPHSSTTPTHKNLLPTRRLSAHQIHNPSIHNRACAHEEKPDIPQYPYSALAQIHLKPLPSQHQPTSPRPPKRRM